MTQEAHRTESRLFITGLPKCGTTWLAENLERAGIVRCSVPKEPNFFSYQQDRSERTRQDYERLFQSDTSGPNWNCDASTTYSWYPGALERAATNYPNGRYILVVRNPVDLVCALHNEEVRAGFELETDLASALELEPIRRRKPVMCANTNFPQKLIYRDVADVAHACGQFMEIIPPGKGAIISLARISAEPERVIKAVADWLGAEVAPDFHPSSARNVRRSYRALPLVRFIKHPPRPIAKLLNMIRTKLHHRGIYGIRTRMLDVVASRPKASTGGDLPPPATLIRWGEAISLRASQSIVTARNSGFRVIVEDGDV